MHSSKPRSFLTKSHLSLPPAMPTARAPLILAIWPTADPTAPDAAATTTVSPGCGLPISSSPVYAVMPGMPSTPTAVETGPSFGSILVSPLPAESAWPDLPAGAGEPDLALGKARMVRGDPLTHRAALHHAADRHRRRIGRAVAHASAHIGIERQPDGAQQNLALARHRHRSFLDAEIRLLRLADGPRGKNDAFCGL